MILSVTGHRPDKLNILYTDETGYELLCRLAADELMRLNPDMVITGMALGWDSAVADACVLLKLPYVAAVPFVGQEKRWSPSAQIRYRDQLQRAKTVEVVCSGPYAPWKMLVRNKWMNERSDELLALYDGGAGGGTAHCVADYRARFPEKRIHNCWHDWRDRCRAR